MLWQVSLAINIMKAPKSLDCMYGTRNFKLGHKTKRYLFSDLFSTMAQTNMLNTYIEPKPLWQDTHEVSQGLEHDTFVNLTHTCMCQQATSLFYNQTMHPI